MSASFYRPTTHRTPRPARRRAGVRPLAWASAALVIGAVAAGGSLLALRLHPRFSVVRVVLEGVPDSRRAEAEELTDCWIGQPLLFVNVDAPVAKISKRPWVARAAARRIVPDTIVVSVLARPPVALARQGSDLVTIDRAGTVLGPYAGRALGGMDDFVVVDGETPDEIARGAAFVARLSEEDPALFRHLSEVKAEPDGVSVYDKVARMRLVLAAGDAAVPSWRAFLALRPELESRGLLTGEADLRFENRIVLKAPPTTHGST